MKKNNTVSLLSLLALLILPLLWTSCSEETDTVEEFPNWQARNTAYWDSLYTNTQAKIAAGDTSWKIIKNWSLQDSIASPNTDYIIVHVDEAGTGSGCPLYTDSVRVHYYGKLLPSTSYPAGYQFASSMSADYNPATSLPATFAVNALTDGFATALQNMHIGDNWTVYVPYTLAYGSTGTTGIPGYSTLIFKIILVAYARADGNLPSLNAPALYRPWTEE